MATLTCPNCDAEVPDTLPTCPNCDEALGVTLFDPIVRPSGRLRVSSGERRPPAIYACFLTSSVLKDPIELESGQIYRVGRSRQSEVCFPSSHVSRLHSEIVREGDAWVVGDLGSKNGTYVNGERVFRRRLQHGDKVSVGHFDLVYQELSREETLELLKRETDVSGEDTAPLRPDLDDFYGDLSKVSIVELVQLVSQNRKTGQIAVEGFLAGSGEANLYFVEGEIVHATFGEQEGVDAAMQLLRLRAGKFSFMRQSAAMRRTIRTPTATLLLKAIAS